MTEIALRRTASVLAISPLVTLSIWYLAFGFFAMMLGIAMAEPSRNAWEWLVTAAFMLGPFAGIAGMTYGFIRFFLHAYDTTPVLVWMALTLAAIGWWVGPGIWVLALTAGAEQTATTLRNTTIFSLGISGLWLAVIAAAFIRHGKAAYWALLGAPFILFWPLIQLFFG